MSKVTCIKNSEDFTKGKDYFIKSSKGRGIIAVDNDNGKTHIILNTNPALNVSEDFFNSNFEINSNDKKIYEGSIEA